MAIFKWLIGAFVKVVGLAINIAFFGTNPVFGIILCAIFLIISFTDDKLVFPADSWAKAFQDQANKFVEPVAGPLGHVKAQIVAPFKAMGSELINMVVTKMKDSGFTDRVKNAYEKLIEGIKNGWSMAKAFVSE